MSASDHDVFNGNGVARELSKRIDSVENAVHRLDDKFERPIRRVDRSNNVLIGSQWVHERPFDLIAQDVDANRQPAVEDDVELVGESSGGFTAQP